MKITNIRANNFCKIRSRVALLFISLVAMNIAYAQMPQYKLVQHGLKGKVESVTERTGECVFSLGEYRFANNQSIISANILLFNENGQLRTEKKINNTGQISDVINYVCTPNSITITRYYPNNSIYSEPIEYPLKPKNVSNMQYTFFSDGTIRTETYLDEYGEKYLKFTYNQFGQVLEKRKYKDGVAKDVYTYEYDSNNLLISYSRMRFGGVVIARAFYQYVKFDSLGNWIMRVEYVQEGDSSERTLTNLTTRIIEYYE